MVTKKCIVCGKEFDARGTDKSCSEECRKENKRRYNRQYYQDNQEHYKKIKKQYYQNNQEHIKQYHKQYYQDNKEHIKQKTKQYRQDNRERIQQYKRQYRQDNKEYIQKWQKQYQQDNEEYLRQYKKQYYQDNKERIQQYRQDNKEYIQRYNAQRQKERVSKLVKQYNGDLEKILENIPSRWQLREAKMQVWFNKSYYDGIMAKIKSTPCCEVTGKKDDLVVHHLYSFSTRPELGADLTNMVRITEEVHKAFHKEYGYGNNTPEQWEEFVSNYLHN